MADRAGDRIEQTLAGDARMPLGVGIVEGLGHRDQVVEAVAVEVGQQDPVVEGGRARPGDVVAPPGLAVLLQPEQGPARPDLGVEVAHEEPAGHQQVQVAVAVEVFGNGFVEEVLAVGSAHHRHRGPGGQVAVVAVDGDPARRELHRTGVVGPVSVEVDDQVQVAVAVDVCGLRPGRAVGRFGHDIDPEPLVVGPHGRLGRLVSAGGPAGGGDQGQRKHGEAQCGTLFR